MRNAVLNAVNNALRKKGSKFIDLWKRKQRQINRELVASHVEILSKVEEREGKSWVDLVYQANNLRKPKRKEVDNE